MMEREVRLSRTDGEPWGFRLIGGSDFNMPLTVVKVIPDSPADVSGLRNGDTVSRISGADAGRMTHDGAKAAVAAAADQLILGVTRGLYDMAIDDYEPICDAIDQDDFDQPSHPTEVFQVQDFTESPLGDDLRFSRSRTGSRGNLDRRSLSEVRFSNESPFLLPNKPYRPFSTEPTPVPPIEDPIILNPAYHDEFAKVEDVPISAFEDDSLLKGFDGLEEILSGKTRFKLPISEQYDPDGTRTQKAKGMTTVTVEERVVKEEITQVTKEVKVMTVEERIKEHKEDIKFMEKMKKEIDLDKIEMTATSIVDESIEKAVTVAGEIKKEIDRELSGFTSELKTTSSEVKESQIRKKEYFQEVKEQIAMTAKTTDVVTKKSDVSVGREVAEFEADDKQLVVDERKAFLQQEIEETIESGSVRRKSEMYDKEVKVADLKVEKKVIDDIENGSVRRKSEMYDREVNTSDLKNEKKSIDDVETGSVKKKSEMFEETVKLTNVKIAKKSIDDTKVDRKQSKIFSDHKDVKEAKSIEEQHKSETKTETVSKTTESVQKSDETKSREAKYTTAKLLAEQRAYTIGLQTIPHIRGTVQSNYHYDLLLKTFFIHLTDVMVALSRFILAEPVLSQPLETKQEVKKEVSEVSQVNQDLTAERKMKESLVEHTKVQTEGKEIQEKVGKLAEVELTYDEIREKKRQEYIDYADKQMEIDEKSKVMLSGAEMSQLCQKHSDDLISKMGGVITEFQTKAGLEDEIVMQRERRSRSRSRLEEDVKKDITEFKTTSHISESMEMNTETRHETKEIKRESRHETRDVKSKDGNNTYIAIVQAHVYTNKNLLEEIAEVSESVSVENIEETKIACESNEAMITECVAVESQARQEIAEIVQSHEMSSAKTEEVIVQEKKDVAQEANVQKSIIEVETKKQVAEVELVETVQPIVELHEDIVEKVSIEKENKMDIQEIQTLQYVSELDVVKEESESVEIVQDVQEIKEVYDVQISEEVQKVETSDHVSSKIYETVINEEICMKTEEVIIEENKDIIEELDVQKSLMKKEAKKEIAEVQVVETVEPIVEFKEETVSVKEEAIAVQDVKVEEIIEDITINEEVLAVQDVKIEEVVEDIKVEEESIAVHDVKVEDFKVTEETAVFKKSSEISDKSFASTDEYAQLKVTKEEITEIDENIEINQEIEVNIKKSVHIAESENKYESYISETSTQGSEFVQETTFVAKSTEEMKKQLTLDLTPQIKKSDSQSSVKSTISTPTPSTVPPTPLTDEYVFRLEIPLPKITGPPIPRSPSPEDEDPHIVKKNLVPHIETAIVEEIVYDTPLPTPPEDKRSPPKFTKPGLKGGNIRCAFYKEEIKEIERKSSLLASAIDETIKSIEEYKEEVGIDKVKNPVVYNGFSKVIDSKVYKEKLDEVNIERQIIQNTENINKIVENRANSEESVKKVSPNGKAATVTVTVENNTADSVAEFGKVKMDNAVETVALEGYRPVAFNPDDAPHIQRVTEVRIPEPAPTVDPGKAFVAANGEIMGTHQGIVDGLEESLVDREVAKDLGKPGMTEEKIAELISGESEMLREAHVMGLKRVLKSHMHRDDDDSSVDFKKIKPIVESLKDSEVLKALNEEFMKTKEEKKKDERKWTKFLQKPARPVPKAKFGYQGWTADEEAVESPYKVKIVKQPKPKVAPDYKPQDFNTGPLPWEERALTEPSPPPIEPEAPILVPEESPQFLEALDTLPESEVPDLEDTGIPLPPEPVEVPTPIPETEPVPEVQEEIEAEEPKAKVELEQPTVTSEADMENRVAEQLMKNVEGMVDPNAPLQQQLSQMRAQLAALAQLPGVIQQTLELVTRQLCQITQQESQSHQSVTKTQMAIESSEMVEDVNETSETTIEDVTEETKEDTQEATEDTQIEATENVVETVSEKVAEKKQEPTMSAEEREKVKREEEEILGEQRRIEKQKKELLAAVPESEAEYDGSPQTAREIVLSVINEMMAELQLEQESRQLKQRPTPRVGKPKPVFGPLTPAERPLVLPGGRKWRKPKDAYNDQFINETLTAQAELIQGKALGKTYESVHLPYDERVNFMKYEKPPITLDHLQNSDVYKMIHGMEQKPLRQVDMLTSVIAEADYREKCRSITPSAERIG